MSALSPNLTIMLRAAEKAAKSLVRDFGEVEHLQVSRKGPANFVSAADTRSEEIIYKELSTARPSFGFLMEERGQVKGEKANEGGEEFRFIVDPLDGTTNFLHGIPHFNISIGLERQTATGREIISALIMDPIKNETFYAEKGTGAFMQKRRLRVSARKELEMAVVGGGDAASKGKAEQSRLAKQFPALIGRTSGFRRMGCAALDLCYVAAGRFDAFWENGLSPWDVAAGSLIVKEAGGSIISLEGDKNPVYADTILASNANLLQPMKRLLEEAV
ncbi:MAG TPA: inositol monophosphatase family protein [Alphaproteobacteria bacterium]|nr:inositol monophosphatase family protein [Alphaproteobacteria bacterium]HNS45097.1 inositol monophosphatase family protein [Alphaproteobacteria bacterium]